jgi:hypothetical protein
LARTPVPAGDSANIGRVNTKFAGDSYIKAAIQDLWGLYSRIHICVRIVTVHDNLS